MATSGLSFGIIGCGPSTKDRVDRFLAIDGVSCVGCCDADGELARTLADQLSANRERVPVFDDASKLILEAKPEALLIATPDRSHYRAAMDGLQAGCHLLLIPPLSTNVQEAVDIVGLARARGRKVAVAHGFRHKLPIIRGRELLAEGTIGQPHLITATLAVASPPIGGVLANVGIDWVDAVLWATGTSSEVVSANQAVDPDDVDLLTVASIRMAGGALASVAISAITRPTSFELVIQGETGRLRATDQSLSLEDASREARSIPWTGPEPDPVANFVDAIRGEASLGCAASEALDAVRVLEAIARSAAIGQFVSLA